MVKSCITLAHGGDLNTQVIYDGILTQENVFTVVNYCSIFITLAYQDLLELFTTLKIIAY